MKTLIRRFHMIGLQVSLILGITAGCVRPAGPVEITEEMAKAASVGDNTLPCFTQYGRFVRNVGLNELNEEGYMVYQARRMVVAVPIMNDEEEIIAVQDYAGSQCMTLDQIIAADVAFFPLRVVGGVADFLGDGTLR